MCLRFVVGLHCYIPMCLLCDDDLLVLILRLHVVCFICCLIYYTAFWCLIWFAGDVSCFRDWMIVLCCDLINLFVNLGFIVYVLLIGVC